MPELKFNVDSRFDQTLTDLVEDNANADNKADVVQRAVATYKYFRNLPAGARIQVVADDGNVLVNNVAVP